MTIRKAPCSTQSPSVFSVNGAQYLKSVRKGVDTVQRKKRDPRFRPVGGHLNGTLTLTDVQTSLRLSPPFGVLCVEDGLKGEGELSSETAFAELPGVARAFPSLSRLDTVATFAPLLLREDEPVVVLSLRPRKKQVNS